MGALEQIARETGSMFNYARVPAMRGWGVSSRWAVSPVRGFCARQRRRHLGRLGGASPSKGSPSVKAVRCSAQYWKEVVFGHDLTGSPASAF